MTLLALLTGIIFSIAAFFSIAFTWNNFGSTDKMGGFLFLWICIQMILSSFGFYQATETLFPRIIWFVPHLLVLFFVFVSPKRRKKQISQISLGKSLFIQGFRLSIELVMFLLVIRSIAPSLITIKGFNFDLIFGITVPIVGLLCLFKAIGIKNLIAWNYVGLFSSIITWTILILSAPGLNIFPDIEYNALYSFPYILIPTTIIPCFIYLHLSNITLLKEMQAKINGQDFEAFSFRNFKHVKNPFDHFLTERYREKILEPKKERFTQILVDLLKRDIDLFENNTTGWKIEMEILNLEAFQCHFEGKGFVMEEGELEDYYSDNSFTESLENSSDKEYYRFEKLDIQRHRDEYMYLIAQEEEELKRLNEKVIGTGLTVERARDENLDSIDVYFLNLKSRVLSKFIQECWIRAKGTSCVDFIDLEIIPLSSNEGSSLLNDELPF